MKPESKFVFAGYEKLETPPPISSKRGTLCLVVPKMRIKMIDRALRLHFSFTDADRKLRLRNNKLKMFKETFVPFLKRKYISILSIVLFDYDSKRVRQYIKDLKRKTLRRLGIESSSYIYVNDIGRLSNKPHWHIFLVTEFIREELFEIIFKKYIQKEPSFDNKISFELMKEFMGMMGYCHKKHLYANENNRTHGNSNLPFEIPAKTKLLMYKNNFVPFRSHKLNKFQLTKQE